MGDNYYASNSDNSVLGGIFVILAIICTLVAAVGILYWIYNDSIKHQVPILGKVFDAEEAPKLWVGACFFCFILAAPYYFYRRAGIIALKTAATQASALPTVLPSESSPAKETRPLTRDLEMQLKEVISLKTKGLITDSEFEQKRRQILGL
jgi:hypothetical protein